MTVGLTGLFDGLPSGATPAGSLTGVPAGRRITAAGLLRASAMWTHIDVMDVPFAGRTGVPVHEIAALVAVSHRVDVHLMVERPDDMLSAVAAGGPDRITVHLERLADPAGTAKTIRELGPSPWLAVSPETSPVEVEAVARHFDGVLVMLLTPGSTGSARTGRLHIAARLCGLGHVGVDGGVDATNLPDVLDAGVGYVVAGRALIRVAATD
ncbi:hypothetical protein GIS00_20355 [Nakamurella sp. YIM 132087]|uniref:Ribulose-phosphate 3-epimerase n=1 Tax=Nakamurella alba TaxID=2665158 RepID=A0A7K1FQ77_9ACTN|nr:hypothetical protein [Nakamurella alba]MTD16296.1 hypothetical protein [Nakamurella alba]